MRQQDYHHQTNQQQQQQKYYNTISKVIGNNFLYKFVSYIVERLRRLVLNCIKRISIYIGIISIIVYWDNEYGLHGSFVYDDAGCIQHNSIVNGLISTENNWWYELFTRDYWGTKLSTNQSHKSFRPITTLSFKINYFYATTDFVAVATTFTNIVTNTKLTNTIPKVVSIIIQYIYKNNNNNDNKTHKQQQQQQQQQQRKQQQMINKSGTTTKTDTQISTYSFHVVNVILHGVVSSLVTEVALIIFSTVQKYHVIGYHTKHNNNNEYNNNIVIIPSIITGLVFGLHPIHSEAVSNMTSRGELLMSFFTLVSFLSYVYGISKQEEEQQQQEEDETTIIVTTTVNIEQENNNDTKIVPNKPLVLLSDSINTADRNTVIQNIQQQNSTATSNTTTANFWNGFIYIYIIPCCCMILSLFSKEQGATTLLVLVCYDFIIHYYSIRQCFYTVVSLFGKKNQQQILYNTSRITNDNNNTNNNDNTNTTTQFSIRVLVLLVQTIIIVLFRKWLNGTTIPDFIYDQNPAGFSSNRLTRFLSIPYIYCLYIYDIILPNKLCPDWSGRSISLLVSLSDVRCIIVFCLLLIILVLFYSLCMGVVPMCTNSIVSYNMASLSINVPSTKDDDDDNDDRTAVQLHFTFLYMYIRQIILISFFAFIVCPFLLSSNILVVIGLMKADRVMYLPLLGFCLLQGLVYQLIYIHYNYNYRNDNRNHNISSITTGTSNDNNKREKQHHTKIVDTFQYQRKLRSSALYYLSYIFFILQMMYYSMKVHERNVAWSSSERLWISAYKINPKSYHTIYNCGYELSLKQRYVESEYVIRAIRDPTIDGPSNTFVYCMVLYNLHRCDLAYPLLDKALNIIDAKENDLNNTTPRNTKSSILRIKSNLLVAKAFCTMDVYDVIVTNNKNTYRNRNNNNNDSDNDTAARTNDVVGNSLKHAGQIMYEAVQMDPTNQYAIDQATQMVKRIELFNTYPQVFSQQVLQSR